MLTPNVREISAVSAHRREVALVRWSLLAVPDPEPPDVRDELAAYLAPVSFITRGHGETVREIGGLAA